MVQSYGKSSATKLQSLCCIIPTCSNSSVWTYVILHLHSAKIKAPTTETIAMTETVKESKVLPFND